MKLLVITQKVNREDPVLGFFHNWISELSKRFEQVSVICLEKGSYDLPDNVEVYSLGKEQGRSRLYFIFQFFNLCFFQSLKYDSIFVHMNQEYVLLGGMWWKLLRKRVYMWRNHKQGSLLTRVAIMLSSEVFYTSSSSYTAKFKKSVQMPVGIDTSAFSAEVRSKNSEVRCKSILFLGRIAPVKNPDIFVEALGILKNRGVDFNTSVYGDALPKDEKYIEAIKQRAEDLGLNSFVTFHSGLPNYQTPDIYRSHGIYVNLTPAGSFDKTILEAAACGCITLTANSSLAGELHESLIIGDIAPESVADRLEYWLKASDNEIQERSKELTNYVLENHSLSALIGEITLCMGLQK